MSENQHFNLQWPGLEEIDDEIAVDESLNQHFIDEFTSETKRACQKPPAQQTPEGGADSGKINEISIKSKVPEVQKCQNERFIDMTHEEVQKFILDQENKNTLKKTQTDLKLVEQFLRSNGELRDICSIRPQEFDPILSDFVIRIRKKDGGEFEPVTLRGIISSIDRKLRRQKYGTNIMGVKDHHFENTRNAVKAKKLSLKRQDKGNFPNRAEAVTDSEVNLMFENGQLGDSTRFSLLNSMWFNNCVGFGLRGVKEHYNLRWGDVTLKQTVDGTEYLELNERATKTRTGEDLANVRQVTPKIFSDGNGRRDPIFLYNLYAEKRPEKYSGKDDPFYIACRTVQHVNPEKDVWFRAQNVGEKKLSQIMKTMAENANLPKSKRITNTSARKRLVQSSETVALNQQA